MVMRELGYEDYDIIEQFYLEKFGGMKPSFRAYLGHLKDELRARDLNGCENSTFLFGLFEGAHMIGHTLGCLQKVRGLGINNGIVTDLLSEYDTEELRKYAFEFVTNAALDAGVLPLDDIQCNPTTPPPNHFNSTDMGYEIVLKRCTLR